jgi:hypothetical protein
VCSSNRRACLALILREVLQQHVVTHQERVDVPPASPGIGCQVERRPLALLVVQRPEKLERRAAAGPRRNAGRLKREKLGTPTSVVMPLKGSATRASPLPRMRPKRSPTSGAGILAEGWLPVT